MGRISGGLTEHEHKVHQAYKERLHEFGKRIGAKPGAENDRKIERNAKLIAEQTKERIANHKKGWK